MTKHLALCQNCGTPTPVAEMLRDHTTGERHCVICPGEAWLMRRYGAHAVQALHALRAGRSHPSFPLGLTRETLVARFPEKLGGNIRADHCRNGHPYSKANTYVSPDGVRHCRTCKRATAANRYRIDRAARPAAAPRQFHEVWE